MKIKSGFVIKKVGGKYMAVPIRKRAVDFSGVITLSESGAFLWEMLEKGAGREELIEKMLAEYAVDRETAARDIDRFITMLRKADLLE